jgi:hypothetical protein
MSRTSRIVMAVMVTAAASSSAIVGVAGNLTEADTAHLIFMRSEEKLARDVYLTIAKMYPDQPVFLTIATRAEQTHTDTMARMLKKFNIPDPEHSTELDTLPPPEQIGVFENYYFAEYFTEKYEYLVGQAGLGLFEALNVGALIEELDMKDINYCNDAFEQYYPEPLPAYPDCGGLSATAVRALQNSLGNLLAGSENHLCAFASQIGPLMGDDECYSALYLEKQEVYDIIEDECIEFIGYICPPEQE